MSMQGLLLTFVFLLGAFCVKGRIEYYDMLQISARYHQVSRYAIYSKEDSLIGTGSPFIRVNFTFRQFGYASSDGRVQVILFPSRQKYIVELYLSSSRQECPILTEVPELGIHEKGSLIYRQFPYSTSIPTLFGVFDEVFDITESAVWYLFIHNCPEYEGSRIEVNGSLEWRNPYGHIDGRDYPLFLLSLSMCVSYSMAILAWIIVVILYRKDMLLLQWLGGLLLILGLFEHNFEYLAYSTYNSHGLQEGIVVPYFVLSAIMGVLKQTATRVLLLLLMLGYSTVRVSLTRPTIITMLGTCLGYGASCLAYAVVKIAPSLRELSPLTIEIVQFPGVMFNLVCFGWFFVGAHNTMRILRQYKEFWKIDKYHRMCILLGVCLLMGTVATLGKGFALIMEWDDVWWQAFWMWDAFWTCLYFVACVVGLSQWRPISNNNYYRLSELMRSQLQMEEVRPEEDADGSDDGDELEDQARDPLLRGRNEGEIEGETEGETEGEIEGEMEEETVEGDEEMGDRGRDRGDVVDGERLVVL